MKTVSRSYASVLLLTVACGSESEGSGLESARATSQPILGDSNMLAVEHGSAEHFGTVAYGANGSFFYRTMAGAFTCDNAAFGDPLPGIVKACFTASRNPNPQVATKLVANSPSGS